MKRGGRLLNLKPNKKKILVSIIALLFFLIILPILYLIFQCQFVDCMYCYPTKASRSFYSCCGCITTTDEILQVLLYVILPVILIYLFMSYKEASYKDMEHLAKKRPYWVKTGIIGLILGALHFVFVFRTDIPSILDIDLGIFGLLINFRSFLSLSGFIVGGFVGSIFDFKIRKDKIPFIVFSIIIMYIILHSILNRLWLW